MMLKIVVTGAPMSGKSCLLKEAKRRLEAEYDIPVFILPEVASDLIENCFTPDRDIMTFQSMLYRIHKTKEDILSSFLPENGILLTDRGLPDGCCYISDDLFSEILAANGDDAAGILSRYDHVIQLQTVCVYKDVSSIDTLSNTNRQETSKDDILRFEEKLKEIYKPHPSYHFIPAERDIEKKGQRLLDLIMSLIS
jgi:predicted ATPase